MNGYVYNGVVVYNLFNINVSGNKSEGLLAGAQFAYNQGWFTREASIRGGAKFLREKYLDKGQSTLYFQKYNVVDQSNLFEHQYMQNIRAANDEGNSIYKAYKNTNTLNSHFEFTIPIYENMPKQACARPLNDTEVYFGDITSQLIDLNVNKNAIGEQYIYGQIVIIEWINGNSKVPRTTPKMTIESTDGTIKQELYVEQISGNTYYFDKYINQLDKSKTYVIKAELTERVNESRNKSMQVKLPNKTFSSAYCKDNYFYAGNYEGGLTHALHNIDLKTKNGSTYITGNIMAIEWINGVSTVPTTNPKMTLKAIDGTESRNVTVQYTSYNDYSFEVNISSLNTGKQYRLDMELTEANNVSKSKNNIVNIPNSTLGQFKNKNVVVKDKIIGFEYEGTVATQLNKLEFHKNSDTNYYISGELNIKEMINGQATVPETLPSLKLVSTDKTVVKNMYIAKTSGNNYYFDGYINGLDKSKQYELIVELTEKNNQASNKNQIVAISNRTLGKEGKVDIVVKDNKLKYQYDGGLTNQLYSLKLNQTADGAYYISGEIMAIEWVNGKSTVPQDKPKMTLVSTDGTVKMETFITPTGTNTYYFDKFIDGIDVSKQYQIKMELTTSYNISNSKVNTVKLSNIGKELGSYKTSKMQVEDNKLVFKNATYVGDMNTELYRFTKGESNGASYVSGEMVVVEWVNGKSTVPKTKPKMRFVSTDGTVNMEVFVTATGTNTYYFDRFIEGIDTSKEYKFMVESTDSNNVSKNRTVPVYFKGEFANKVIGTYAGKQIKLENNKIVFKTVNSTYKGDLNTELYRFNKGEANGASYISGEMVVVEWVNGKSTVPKVKPKMRFVSTDGSVDMEVFVTATGTNTYYFDRYIEGIDTSKQYKFMVESGDKNNISENRIVPVYFKGEFANKIIGTYLQKTMILENNMIKFK